MGDTMSESAEDKPKRTLAKRCDDFVRRQPLLFFVLVALLGFLCGPLILAASKVTAVLYKDF
jgi:hypothetical protein